MRCHRSRRRRCGAAPPAASRPVAPQAGCRWRPLSDMDHADFDPEIAAIFSEEAVELLEAAETALAAWNAAPHDSDQVAALRRPLHTLKGGARMAGIDAMGELSHELESLITPHRESASPAPMKRRASVAQEALDELARMREAIASGRSAASVPALIARIQSVAAGEAAAAPAAAPAPMPLQPHTPAADSLDAPQAPVEQIELHHPAAPMQAVQPATESAAPSLEAIDAALSATPVGSQPTPEWPASDWPSQDWPSTSLVEFPETASTAEIKIEFPISADEFGTAPSLLSEPAADSVPPLHEPLAPHELAEQTVVLTMSSLLSHAATSEPPAAAPPPPAPPAPLPPGREPVVAADRVEMARVSAELLDQTAQQRRRGQHCARPAGAAARLDRIQSGRAVAHRHATEGAAAQARDGDRGADPAPARERGRSPPGVRSAGAGPLFVDSAVLARTGGIGQRRRQHPGTAREPDRAKRRICCSSSRAPSPSCRTG